MKKSSEHMRLIGPFKQLLTMNQLPPKGPLADKQLEVLEDAAILVHEKKIVRTGPYNNLIREARLKNYAIEHISEPVTGLPGFIDPHTHICWSGSRAGDYAMRIAGKTYLEIAKNGGGIWDTVAKTRQATFQELEKGTSQRAEILLRQGITTVEVKSGYCLTVEGELKLLKVIQQVNCRLAIDLIPTCLAAHIPAKDFPGDPGAYLDCMINELLPKIRAEKLSKRIDIFVEESAFTASQAAVYLHHAIQHGFDITVHADQFSPGGSELAVHLNACSADHLEAASDKEIKFLANSNVTAVALPGASLGLGERFTPARKLLDAGTSLAIGSDWNPGSAPIGHLLVAASILSAYEHLTTAETLAAITCRAAAALNLADRGSLAAGQLADIIAFPVDHYQEILYHQGMLAPRMVWKEGRREI